METLRLTLTGFGVAFAILFALGLYIWINSKRSPFWVDCQVSTRGIRLKLWGWIPVFFIRAERIVGVRIIDCPFGQFWEDPPFRVLHLGDRPFADEGVFVLGTNGRKYLLTPPSPKAFVEQAVASGMAMLRE